MAEEPSAAEVARDEASVEALEHGGLPVTATERLSDKSGTFTSDLSVDEMVVLREVGYQPLGLVMGASVYRLANQYGWQYYGTFGGGWSRQYPCPHGYYHDGARSGYNWEHRGYSAGMGEARQRAISRLMAEATALNAAGVAGVRITLSRLPDTYDTIEFKVIGTALSIPGEPTPAQPFTCNLSGQDLAKLLRAGYAPVHLAFGACSIEVDPGCATEWQMMSAGNTEIHQHSDAVVQLQDLAMTRLVDEARHAGADGLVGVEIARSTHELSNEVLLMDLVITATAVRRFEMVDVAASPPLLMMTLRDR
jgi:uncharacterized protein YbjQ (UPF0145 family)